MVYFLQNKNPESTSVSDQPIRGYAEVHALLFEQDNELNVIFYSGRKQELQQRSSLFSDICSL